MFFSLSFGGLRFLIFKLLMQCKFTTRLVFKAEVGKMKEEYGLENLTTNVPPPFKVYVEQPAFKLTCSRQFAIRET